MNQHDVDQIRASISSVGGGVTVADSGLTYVIVGNRVCILQAENDGFRVACSDQALDRCGQVTVQMWLWAPAKHVVSVVCTMVLSDHWVISRPNQENENLTPLSNEEWEAFIRSRMHHGGNKSL